MRPGDFDKTRLQPLRSPRLPDRPHRGRTLWILAMGAGACLAIWALFGGL